MLWLQRSNAFSFHNFFAHHKKFDFLQIKENSYKNLKL